MPSRRPEITQVGTVTEHGVTWPVFAHGAFRVEVCGSIGVRSKKSAERWRKQLAALLEPHGVEVKVAPVTVDVFDTGS